MTNLLLSAAASAFVLAVAIAASTRGVEPTCPVQVKFTYHGYDGPIVLEDICLSAPVIYADGLLTVEAREFLGDGLFRDGFDVVFP